MHKIITCIIFVSLCEAASVASDEKSNSKSCDNYYTERFANMSDPAPEKKSALSLAEQFQEEEADRKPLIHQVAQSKKEDQIRGAASCKDPSRK